MTLQEWLNQRNMTGAALARELDIDPSVVNRALNGKRNPTGNLIARFFFRFGEEETVKVFDSPLPTEEQAA